MDKESIRKDILVKLRSLTNDQILSYSFSITKQLIKFLQKYPHLIGQVGAGYLPLSSEVAPNYQELWKKVPLDMGFPVLIEGEMKFGLTQGLPRGKVWLEQPYSLVSPAWVLVPGLGFDFSGARLGRGKGYFDKYLSKYKTLRIGIAWSEQLITKIPVEQHDCSMDFIITEEFCWDVNQQISF